MKQRKSSGVIIRGGVLAALIAVFATIGIFIGLLLPSPFRAGGSDDTAPEAQSGEAAKQSPASGKPSGRPGESPEASPGADSGDAPSDASHTGASTSGASTAGDTSPDGTADGNPPPSDAPSANAAAALEPSPLQPPDDAPDPGRDDPVALRAREIVDSMTLYEKVCQMILVSTDGLTGVSGTTVAGSVTKAALEKYPVGGIGHSGSNIVSSEQILDFNTKVQTYVDIPLFLAVNEEGGRASRLKSRINAHSLGAMLSYENDGADVAYSNAVMLSDILKKHGFNTNYAPVADVWSNPDNTVIGDRAYSTDFDKAVELVAAAVRGFCDSNMICTVKHFPGHGDTSEDSHYSAAYINKTLDELRASELRPFAAGIAAGADMVMTGHLIVPEIDELPATLSKKILTGILREELGFDGVILTDALEMDAIKSHYTTQFVAVTAINAGVDMLMLPGDIGRSVTAIMDAVESGEITEARIDESVMRIIMLKLERGIIAE